MRGTRVKIIRKFCRQSMKAFPDLLEPEQFREFYRYAKKSWNKDRWKTLKKELEQYSSGV